MCVRHGGGKEKEQEMREGISGVRGRWKGRTPPQCITHWLTVWKNNFTLQFASERTLSMWTPFL
jgi:hypothetical protein